MEGEISGRQSAQNTLKWESVQKLSWLHARASLNPNLRWGRIAARKAEKQRAPAGAEHPKIARKFCLSYPFHFGLSWPRQRQAEPLPSFNAGPLFINKVVTAFECGSRYRGTLSAPGVSDGNNEISGPTTLFF